jgi:lysophospholipase L1-like esterase
MPKRIFLSLIYFAVSIAVHAENLPKLFLVGDSISIYYTPYLETDVSNHYKFSRKTSPAPETIAEQLSDPNVQGGNSRMVLEYLEKRYSESNFAPDIVLINTGLHDIKRIPQTNVVAIASTEYRTNLEKIISLVRKHHGRIIWISTTPVDDARHNALSKEFFRYDRDVVQYNDIANNVFTRAGVPIIDLYTFTKQLGPSHYIDHVHWDEITRVQQAAYIAGFISSLHASHALP